MNERQAYALAHPINNARGRADPKLRCVRRHPRYNILTILAIDR